MTADDAHPFEPDWTLAPGDFLSAVLGQRGILVAELAAAAGLDPKITDGILDATTRVDGLIAERLEKALGIPSGVWLNLEAGYRRDLERGAVHVACSNPMLHQDLSEGDPRGH